VPAWKLRIFVRAVRARMEAEEVTAEQALESYPALTEQEKQQILDAV